MVENRKDQCVAAHDRVFFILTNMSAKTAPTQVRGHAPKNPPKNRQMKMVWASCPVATATLKMLKPKLETINGIFLP